MEHTLINIQFLYHKAFHKIGERESKKKEMILKNQTVQNNSYSIFDKFFIVLIIIIPYSFEIFYGLFAALIQVINFNSGKKRCHIC